MPILNYTTKIEAMKTVGEISQILVKHGASKIMQEYDTQGRIEKISFMIQTPLGLQMVKLPSNVHKIKAVLEKQRIKCDYAQAERVAWRIIKDWIAAQMAILETEMVTIDEVFLPYIQDNTGRTIYQLFTGRQILLTGGAEKIS
jgi:hypothetical protein